MLTTVWAVWRAWLAWSKWLKMADHMATEATETEELGPIDYLVIEFPGNRFNGEIAPAMTDLIERGVVRLLDLVVIVVDTDGTITVVESDEIGVEDYFWQEGGAAEESFIPPFDLTGV